MRPIQQLDGAFLPHDEIQIEDGTIAVQRMDGRRVDRVKFVPVPVPAGAEVEGGDRR